MKKYLTVCFAVLCFSLSVFAQIPTTISVNIVKAEDERRFDKTLEDLLKNRAEKIRVRAALAAGRIGDERAVAVLIALLEKDSSNEVRTTAAFALGEIESLQGAAAISRILADPKNDGELRARAVEAAGKIAAANPKDNQSKQLGEAILDALEYENARREQPNTDAILFGLTAVLRVRPEDGDFVAAKFLNYLNPRIRADAANTLSRLRAKNADEQLRAMLLSEDDANARANVARALGAAEDQDAFDSLLEAAVSDEDSRVRVSAIRSLGNLKNKTAADKLLERGATLLEDYKKSKFANPSEKSELLEIATTLGRILPNSADVKAVIFLDDFHAADRYTSPETEIALARIAPQTYFKSIAAEADVIFADWQTASAALQGLGEIAALESNAENDALKSKVRLFLVQEIGEWISHSLQANADGIKPAIPDLLRAFAAFKSANTANIFIPILENEPDVFIRAAAAEILGEQKPTKEIVEALKTAFAQALKTDKETNDAQLAILSALVKTEKTSAASSLNLALAAPDYLIRRTAADLIKQNDLSKDFPNLKARVGAVKMYNPLTKTRLGQISNTNADYARAVSRKNARAILTTEKGTFTIEFAPPDAPLTVDNYIKLAKSGYFNGLMIHRVVPNFVMQDGDPRGDGNGSPGYSIRDEINMLSYERGAVGMALSGKDTGGSQWFVTHGPQPHLDGGYTVFGKVSEADMKIVDKLVRGDKITSVKIVDDNSAAPHVKKGRKAGTER
ncbi:MAG: peptidylprolyl isomerase [Acidobacteriota bacterium]|nr:peptidylprolyl isomerase [Acidobacteriota bacterium]